MPSAKPKMRPNSPAHPDWHRIDQAHVWHPYAAMPNAFMTQPVVGASGVEIELADGQRLIDGMSAWWAAIHGYNVAALNNALTEQASRMAHVMFGGLAHEPAAQLARRLVDLTAEPLAYVFFADSGSVAIEVAIKVAFQYWFARGETQRQRLLTVRGGYHGDTFGAMSVCDPVNGMHGMFNRVLPKHLFAPAPACGYHEPWDEAYIHEFEQLLDRHRDELAAVIVEPIVQGAGGMRFYSPDYLRRLRQLCDDAGILLIFDEIATGFGRTGQLFGYQHAGVVPDIMCVGKALTGGYMTLAATLTTERIAAGLRDASGGVLMHGPTFMGNPLACSVAAASIDLLLDTPWQERVRAIETQLSAQLAPCAESDRVADVRVMGAIGVVELVEPVDMHWLQPRLVELGVWIRPFGRLLYIMPPFVIEAQALARLTAAIRTVVEEMA